MSGELERPTPDFSKLLDTKNGIGVISAIIQNQETLKVLMSGVMNQDAIDVTLATGYVTFFSRSKGRLWTKGETSGNFLLLKAWRMDCDNDTLLIEVEPMGPTCHREAKESCFDK